jgi:DNA end-binding protein Ku
MTVLEFVPLSTIDPIYVEKTYFLEPDKGGELAYDLFGAAMEAEGSVALMKCFMKTKEHLAMVGVNTDGTLTLSTLYYEDEIVLDNAHVRDHKVDDKQLAMARMIIASDTSEAYDPSKYKDEHTGRILAMIADKVEGKVLEAPTPIKSVASVNILDQLTKTLEGRKVA